MTMPTLLIHTVLPDKILVSRESAHLLEDAIRRALSRESGEDATDAIEAPLVVDFEGVEGIAPSFLDELLSIFESLATQTISGPNPQLIVANPPTRLSSKFEAVARGHAMVIESLPDGTWRIQPANEMQR